MRFFNEGVQVLRFSTVGLLATATHLGILAIVIWLTDLPPQLVHTMGYAGAFAISFFGHYHVTFRSDRSYRSAMPRFVLASAAVYLASSLVILLARMKGVGDSPSLLIAAFSVPLFSYILNRNFVY